MSTVEGGCFCGAVRFKVDGPFGGVGVCHCADCQRAGGGAPNYVALAPKAAFEVTQGEPSRYTSKGDSGASVTRVFCGTCGSPLWSEPEAGPYAPVKLGALDDASALSPQIHLYVSSAPPWHLMHEGLPKFEKMPPFPPPSPQA
jgi:hypothetical protein